MLAASMLSWHALLPSVLQRSMLPSLHDNLKHGLQLMTWTSARHHRVHCGQATHPDCHSKGSVMVPAADCPRCQSADHLLCQNSAPIYQHILWQLGCRDGVPLGVSPTPRDHNPWTHPLSLNILCTHRKQPDSPANVQNLELHYYKHSWKNAGSHAPPVYEDVHVHTEHGRFGLVILTNLFMSYDRNLYSRQVVMSLLEFFQEAGAGRKILLHMV
mmetsp:Transcript_92872/g.178327  ORF Transcript_92872/g.178327 Transcript_92872/m.178327 type:complete len:215 (+) Transcript_92872:408-1052(+)